MVTFDDVLPTVARVCEASPGFDQIACCGLVRDLRGNVRIVIDPGSAGAALDRSALETSLTTELGRWFVGPILSTSDAQERGRLARSVFEQAEKWTPTWQDPATGTTVEGRLGCWYRLERRLSKEEWLSSRGDAVKPPWPLRKATPGVVTFYSFKGGVGRTTALVSCAWQLARKGHRVVAIDLDLEAPGLGALLDCNTDRGVLDFVVDHLATGESSLHGLYGPARALGDDADKVTVLPAGRLGMSFLEKLGRLDFAGSDPWKASSRSPVERALEELLRTVKRELNPDYILIDSRAGLHDIAGLSLHRLAHVDVLVGRASAQGYEGLDLTIAALAGRKKPEQMRTVILHTMTPPDPDLPEARAEQQEFRARVWNAFRKCIYEPLSLVVAEDTPEAHHIPIAIPFDNALTRFSSLVNIGQRLFGGGYGLLADRIDTLCAPEDEGAT